MRAAFASASPRSLAASALRRTAPLHTEARIK
jgi:hypothetical protein